MSTNTKLPIKFIRSIEERFPDTHQDFLSAITEKIPKVSVRINPNKANKLIPEGSERIPWCENGYFLPYRPEYIFDPLYHAGAYYSQEASSMIFPNFLEDIPDNAIVLDLCAAPGGKSSLLLSILSENSLLISNELVYNRAEILYENLTKWGNMNVIITNNKSSDFLPLGSYFDVILVDAPCSGEGMFRKDIDAVKSWSPAWVLECASAQKNILSDTLALLKNGGTIVYSTCTFEPQENELQLRNFIEKNNLDIAPISLSKYKEWGLTPVEITKGLEGYYAYPHLAEGEGLFVCAFKVFKKERLFKHSEIKHKILPLEIAEDWINPPKNQNISFFEKDEFIYALKKEHLIIYNKLTYLKLRFLKQGVKLFRKTVKNLIPEQELAHSFSLETHFNKIELSLYEALQYLKGNTFQITDDNNISEGNDWVLYTYNGLALGFAKKVDNRLNNNYPKMWRIRKDIPEKLKS